MNYVCDSNPNRTAISLQKNKFEETLSHIYNKIKVLLSNFNLSD